MTDNTKSPEQLEREIEASRAEVNNTLNEIRERMSPGQLVDEALSFAKNNGGAEFGRNLATQARDNPLPVLLIGAGIAWLMSGRRPPVAQPAYPTHFGSEKGVMEKVGDAISNAAGSVRRTAHDARDAVAGAAGSAGDSASGAYGSARDAASGAYSSASDMYERRREQGEALVNNVSQQPMLVAALGLAVGAALGGVLPATRTEDRLMGGAADELKTKGQNAAADGYERGREVVKAAVEGGESEAERQGLVPAKGSGNGSPSEYMGHPS